jgi:chromosomal replication initiation ATPase DnaA
MTLPQRQIPLDLGSRTAHGRDDFMIAPCNESAVNMIDRWPDWPTPLLVLYGPAACGKSHLSAVWREKTNATNINPENLMTEAAEIIARRAGATSGGGHIVLDGIDPWVGDVHAETTLFHLYNIFMAEKRFILMTMRMAPGRAEFAIPDLASRVRASLNAGIVAPDDALLSSVLIKLFHDRQIAVGADVIKYLLPRMERSFAAARDIAEAIDHLSLAEKKPVTISLARAALTSAGEIVYAPYRINSWP